MMHFTLILVCNLSGNPVDLDNDCGIKSQGTVIMYTDTKCIWKMSRLVLYTREQRIQIRHKICQSPFFHKNIFQTNNTRLYSVWYIYIFSISQCICLLIYSTVPITIPCFKKCCRLGTAMSNTHIPQCEEHRYLLIHTMIQNCTQRQGLNNSILVGVGAGWGCVPCGGKVIMFIQMKLYIFKLFPCACFHICTYTVYTHS